MDLRNVPMVEDFFLGTGVKIVTGSRYLDGFVGDGAAEKSWLAEKVEGWAESTRTLAGVAHKHL